MLIGGDGHRPRTAGIDITAMVDVVFLLMVFFLTTLSIDEIVRTDVELPDLRGEELEEAPTPGLVINVRSDGVIIVEQTQRTVAEALAMVSAEVGERGGPGAVDVLVRADGSASLAVVNDLARGLVEMGVPGWRLATDPTGSGAGGAP